ncbi:UTRA domain-containing protein [Enterococcus casseliflavus]|uniref:UTRA domain-containing protein n=1 Tax=Enterococcus casseliflavus TaxID=37734 RepID=UPI003D0D504A
MELLRIDKCDPVYEIQRVRYVDGQAKSIENSVMPLNLVHGLNEEILRVSVYNHIRSELGLTISASQRIIIASKADKLYGFCCKVLNKE